MSDQETLKEWLDNYEGREADELLLYLENDEEIYRHIQQISKTLQKRLKNGTYNHTLAPKAWEHVANHAAKKYPKDILDIAQSNFSRMFSTTVRRAVAADLAKTWYAEAKRGNFP